MELLTGIGGKVADNLEKYKEGELQKHAEAKRKPELREGWLDHGALVHALRTSANLGPLAVGYFVGGLVKENNSLSSFY